MVIWSMLQSNTVPNQKFEVIIRLYICVECSITLIFGILKTWKTYFRPLFISPNQTILKRVSVFVSLLPWYDVWNLECFILPGWLEQTFNRRILPNPNSKGIVNSVRFCRMFHYVHFQFFGEMKTRFLHIDPFAYVMNIVNIFDVWKNIIGM
jgi:hypothetical protein